MNTLSEIEREKLTSNPELQEEAHVRGAYDYLGDKKLSARFAIIAGLIEQNRCGSVLDVGCMNGELRAVLDTKHDYFGIDISSTTISNARSRFLSMPRTKFICGDIRLQQMPAGTFSCVVWAGIGYGYSNKETGSFTDIFSKVCELAEPNGTLIFECISEYNWIEEEILHNASMIDVFQVRYDVNSPHPNRYVFLAKNNKKSREKNII